MSQALKVRRLQSELKIVRQHRKWLERELAEAMGDKLKYKTELETCERHLEAYRWYVTALKDGQISVNDLKEE